MKRLLLITPLLFLASLLSGADLEWLVDLNAALKKAAAEDKAILLNFTGPDDQSQKLRVEILEDPEFAAFARANLVLVEVDLTPDPKQSEHRRKMIERLVDEFDVESAPLIYILDKKGVRLAKGGYVEGGAKNYISLIQKIPGFRLHPYVISAPPKGLTNLPEKAEQPFVVLVPVVPFDDLYLKGVSFGTQKTAMINNKTLAEGESAMLRVGKKWIRIQLLQIREASAIIQVEDEANTRELYFRARAEPTAKK